MKPLTKATQRRFKPMLERLPDYYRENFKNERLELRSQLREDGIPNTTMELFSVRPGKPDKYPSQVRHSMMFANDLFEKRYMRSGFWNVPLTDSNVELIFHCWPVTQIVLRDKLTAKRCAKILGDTRREELVAKIISSYKEKKRIPVDDCVEKEDRPLLGYQKACRHAALRLDSFALLMEQGTGKTPAAISVMANDFLKARKQSNQDFYRAVIICPKNVRSNWADEIAAFCPLKHKVTVIRGNKYEREAELIKGLVKTNGEEMSFVIASYGALRTTLEAFTFKEILKGLVPIDSNLLWDMGVLDEIHYIKSPKAKRTIAAHALRDSCKKRMGLTGTPILNSLFDLWAIWEYLGKYKSGFSNFQAFKDFYAEYEKNVQTGRRTVSGYVHIPLMQERLARTSFIISKKEALPDLPEKVYDTVEVSMTKEQAKIYDQVMRQLYVEIENELDASDNKEMTINNVLTKLLRLAQITSGFAKWDAQYSDDGEVISEGKITRFDPNPKLDTLAELLKDRDPREKTIVWGTYHENIDAITDRLKAEGIDAVSFTGRTSDKDRQTAIHRFNCDPSCQVIIANAAAGGTGVNLLGYDYRNQTNNPKAQETVCNMMVYYSYNWSLGERSQSEDRAHRRGTKSNVRIATLVVPNSIDDEIYHRVKQKISVARNLTDLKQILQRIANPLKEDISD